jgi:proteasome lid subunit RPN8/RPN11
MSWRVDALAHARAEYPRESCGLVMADGRYLPARNLASSAREHFILDARDYARAAESGEIVAVVHSHPDASANPSDADRVACEASGLPWYIVGLPDGMWRECAPCGYRAPLIGRPFVHGILDCYSLVRDWYAERGIALPDFHRDDEWWRRGGNLYLDHYAEAGFVRLGAEAPAEPREGDVILMQVLADVPNHAAIWLPGDVILHHLHGRLSCRDVYGGYWHKHTHSWLRHRSLA